MTSTSIRCFQGFLILSILLVVGSCKLTPWDASARKSLDELAQAYVKLVLDVGQHDPDYVDAYYGPAKWKKKAESSERSLDQLAGEANALDKVLQQIPAPLETEEMEALRHDYLVKQLSSVRARIAMLQGKELTFDEESKALYDAVAPTHTEEDFAATLANLGKILPGEGSLADRYASFQSRYVIPPDRLEAVFQAAIDECRKRTKKYMQLPSNESFVVEQVKGKSWSAYNWYQGNGQSLIQVNVDVPIEIDRAIDLACHEGYPGHHVYNALLEKNLAQDRNWVEFSIYPLFSPQSLIAEGTANFGIEVAFPGNERKTFEKETLFPLAGLDPESIDEYYEMLEFRGKLTYAGNEAARRYLDGKIDREEAEQWLMRYALLTPELAKRRVRFFDQYRSYVINYNLGQDMVREYIERKIGAKGTSSDRWAEFKKLLSSPRLPSGLLD